ncbi:MAG: AIR synthase family protein [Candidatus Helarchaeota archaeon]
MDKELKFKLPGKIPNKYLSDIVFNYLGTPNDKILYGAGIGRDAAAISFTENKVLIIKADPITGAVKYIGRYAIIINANDIAVLGGIPQFFTSTILLPTQSSLYDLETICRDIDEAAKELGISIVGGHSEITEGIKNPIICGSMIGETNSEKLITAQSTPGDKLVMTKAAAIEGTAILAWDKEKYLQKKVKKNLLENAKSFIKLLSIVQEAKIVLNIGGITAMHDPTEGGIVNGIYEMCIASNVGANIYKDKIPIKNETLEICKIFNLNPLRLISSGTLLMSVKPRALNKILSELNSQKIPASLIGEIIEEKRISLHSKDGTVEKITDQNQDQLWKVYSTN